MSSNLSLKAAGDERKARLAQLKSLKRKQAPTEQDDDGAAPDGQPPAKSPRPSSRSPPPSVTSAYLSGRNYDAAARAPKLGFEHDPSAAAVTTLEKQAEALAEQARAEAAAEQAAADTPLDLTALRPKKPNADLRRELDRKLELLQVRTDNAIARLIRERMEAGKKAAGGVGKELKAGDGDGEMQLAGGALDGVGLVEAMHVREKAEEEDERRERELEDMDDAG